MPGEGGQNVKNKELQKQTQRFYNVARQIDLILVRTEKKGVRRF